MPQDSRIIMGMPVQVAILDAAAGTEDIEAVFSHFAQIDRRFSPFRADSELSKINRGEISLSAVSAEMHEILALAEKTKTQSDGYFDISCPGGGIDPSGIVKGWAIHKAALSLRDKGFENFFIDAGGDIQSQGCNARGEPWRVGIRNPFKAEEVVKVVYPQGAGIATSGSYRQGAHIYNPLNPAQALDEIVSLTVIGGDILEADRFATAAFAMGRGGIGFIEAQAELEGYEIDASGMARMTSGLKRYLTC